MMVKRRTLADLLAKIDQHHPKASLLYARIILALAGARDRSMIQSDLSDALGRGRDSSAVQKATARLADLGIVTRSLQSAAEEGANVWLIRLAAGIGDDAA